MFGLIDGLFNSLTNSISNWSGVYSLSNLFNLSSWSGVFSLSIAAFLDYLIGDPVWCLHPVQVMGWLITNYQQVFQQSLPKGLAKDLGKDVQHSLERWAGILLVILLIGSCGLMAAGIIWVAIALHPVLGVIVSSVIFASCLAGRSLRDAAEMVLAPLQRGDLTEARQVLRGYVGRDTAELSAPEIYRAVLETVTENATDGVMAPLFYGLVGIICWGLPGLGLAIAYKAASTLDSMVGYLHSPYTYFGWSSAKLEDLLTWWPCRLHVLTLAVFSGRPGDVLKICRRDAPQDPSPNSGWSECIYAAILGVQVGGDNFYQGVVKSKPLLGDDRQPITEATIYQALKLTRYSFLCWLSIGCLGIVSPMLIGFLNLVSKAQSIVGAQGFAP